jgi:predicted ATPase/DNA-binding SARP family transcriptional activator
MTRWLEPSGVAVGAQLRLTLFGAPRITHGEQPLSFAYEKAQALLVYLAVEGGRAHRRTALADLLWPEHEPAAARHNLSQALFTLRRALGDDPHDPLLLTTRDSAQLNSTCAVSVDVATFRAIVSDPQSTLAQLEQAAALYGGEFLAGFSIGDSAVFEEWATLVREQLHRQMGELLCRLTDTQQGLDAAHTYDYARRWVALDPLDEEAQRRLIRALFETGQRSAALAQFEQCRRLLQAELGLEPEPATLALVEELRQRVVPAPPASRPRPARSAAPGTVVDLEGRVAVHSYAYPVRFVGRARELAEVSARLTNPDCRLLTLTGLGGSGKTRLALEAASRIVPHFPHGTFFASLQPLSRSDQLVPAIAQALGLALDGDREPLEQLLDALQDKRLLLILDNIEHLLDGVSVLSSLLRQATGVKLLATSREALRLAEEWLYPLGGLSTPPDARATSLEDYEAVQLFLSHARRVQPRLKQDEEQEAIACICRLTGGLPLALELAASWLKGSSAARIAHEMQRSLDVLATTTRNVEERHRSMRAVFNQSWDRLGERERLIFARLAVFSCGFDGDAAEAVAGASFASLAALVEKSLLQLEPKDRFGIHELLRQYAMEQLESYGEREATEVRHSHYFAQFVGWREAALHRAQQEQALRVVERDWENICLAWEWSVQKRHTANLGAMLNGLYLFGILRSRQREIVTLLERALGQPLADTPLRGRLLARRWGYLQWGYHADNEEARAGVEQALTIAQAENNQFELAFCYLMDGYVKLEMQRYADALPALERSKALFETLDEPYYLCWVLHRLGYVYNNLNHIAQGIDYTEQSLALARLSHNWVARIICLHNLGSNALLHGDVVKGQQYCLEALQAANEAGSQSHGAHTLGLLALGAFLQGDYIAAQGYAERAHTISEELRRFASQAYSLALLMLLACLREDYAEGLRLSALAQRHSTNTMGDQLLCWARATLACGLARPAEARAHIQKALQLAVPEINPGPTIWIVPCAAYTLVESDPATAVELLSWVASYPESVLNWARHWPLFDRLLDQLWAATGAEAYELRWEYGKALSFADITSYLQHAYRI